jgi:hypothetical protein
MRDGNSELFSICIKHATDSREDVNLYKYSKITLKKLFRDPAELNGKGKNMNQYRLKTHRLFYVKIKIMKN